MSIVLVVAQILSFSELKLRVNLMPALSIKMSETIGSNADSADRFRSRREGCGMMAARHFAIAGGAASSRL